MDSGSDRWIFFVGKTGHDHVCVPDFLGKERFEGEHYFNQGSDGSKKSGSACSSFKTLLRQLQKYCTENDKIRHTHTH